MRVPEPFFRLSLVWALMLASAAVAQAQPTGPEQEREKTQIEMLGEGSAELAPGVLIDGKPAVIERTPDGTKITPLGSPEGSPSVRFGKHVILGGGGATVAQADTLMVKASYLGVTTATLDPALRAQLDLPEGFGLQVTFVEKDSPAEKAGLQGFDVLTKLDEQHLINVHQFTTLIRARKPGGEIKLTYFRKAKEHSVSATLIEKEVPQLGADPNLPQDYRVYRPNRGSVRLGPHVVVFRDEPVRIPVVGPASPDELHDTLVFNPVWSAEPYSVSDAAVMRISDGEHDITFSVRDGKRSLTAKKSATGEVLYDGPINDAASLEKVPKAIRRKIEGMNLRLKTKDGGVHDLAPVEDE